MSEFVLSTSKDRPPALVSSTQSTPPETHKKRHRVETDTCSTGGMCRDSVTHKMGSALHDDGVAEVADNRASDKNDESIKDLLSYKSSKSRYI